MDWANAVKKGHGKIADGLVEYDASTQTIPAVIKNLNAFDRADAYTVAFMYLQILEASRKDDLAKYVKSKPRSADGYKS